MGNPLVAIDDLHLSLVGGSGRVNILRGIDLQLAAGETLSVAGTSGAGKTTLLMAIAGLEQVSAGRIRIAGVDITGLDEDALARFRRRHVGIVFQSFHLVATMTAAENIALPLEFAGIPDAAEQAAAALASVGLAARRHHYPGQLSGGEQQRVALARAFVARPALLLADEPTGNLDAETGARVMELLFALQAEQGTTLLLVTHDPALAERCSRRLLMRDGVLLAGPGKSR
ncbi:ABC transporter ATP-binding protein [Desulfuromonas carbonis]|uniref:ABC transporter ATP-binding protein n=1 Tax=Desulfuromonas sp. DDH964 TaxID=1823759 RepID=UPI00078B5AE1|nr:ABC transporter ATP-binding protein [Desulfuromonas sp. DDH964]AMV71163.1 ABC transporter ATP-binding protein [Desulfuromonas sp. DDH964]